MLDEAEVVASEQVGDVLDAAGEQVVDADDPVAVGEQPLAEVRAEEAGAAGDERGGHARVSAAAVLSAGRPSGRPIETYSNPAAAILAGS